MSSDPPGRWSDSESPAGPDPLSPSAATPDGKGLKGMLADAMAKSRGQGVVQGSTLFFKNLAESVAHSNRNLKIGLGFLMAAFVVVASGLGYLVFQAFQAQEQTKVSLESKLESQDARTKAMLQPFLDGYRQIEERMANMEAQHKLELETVRVNAQQDVDNARQEVARLRLELAETQKKTVEIYDWAAKTNKVVEANFTEFGRRLQALESRR